MNLKSIIGKTCLIKYEDASYSYLDIIKKNIGCPKPIITIGKLRRVDEKFIDLGFSWTEDDKFYGGVIIPKKAIIDIKVLNEA